MKVFISWSGKLSHQIAQALSDWIPMVIQRVDPFLSSEDIQKGAVWFDEIGSQLEMTDFGILCLTPENLNKPWIMFEAGALSKKVGKAWVVPLLIDLTPMNLTPPLSLFNAAGVAKQDIYKLLQTINTQTEDKLKDKQLEALFDSMWPQLEAKFQEAQATAKAESPEATKAPERTTADLVEELLVLTRGMSVQVHVLSNAVTQVLGRENAIREATIYELTNPDLSRIGVLARAGLTAAALGRLGLSEPK